MLEEPIETIATAEDSLVDVIPTSPEEENLEPEPSIPEEPIEITNISE